MTLVPTRWWASFFMPSCLLLMGLAVGIAWCLWAWKRGRTPRQARLIPLPCDFMTRGPAEELSPTLLIPRGHALWRVDTVAKEWLGMLAGR
jgi:hypothetical protein